MGNSPCFGGGRATGAIDSNAVFVGHRIRADEPSDSDHNAILFSFGGSRRGDEAVTLLSWNILCQYGYNEEWGYPFDGFNRRVEGGSEYVSRLHRTAAEVLGLVERHRPRAILLQECAEPGEFGHGVLTALLLDCLSPHGYTVLDAGEFVTALRAGSALTLALPALQRQAGKLHVVCCDELNVIVLNAHFLWDGAGSANEKATRLDLEAVLSSCWASRPGAQVFLAGDTNRVPQGRPGGASTIDQLVDGLGALCRPPGPTNVCWNCDKQTSEMTYADFAIRCAPSRI